MKRFHIEHIVIAIFVGFIVGVTFGAVTIARWARYEYCPSILKTLNEEATHVER